VADNHDQLVVRGFLDGLSAAAHLQPGSDDGNVH
jgi:hypothetical protein